MSKIFIDTNVLVYCMDEHDLKKRDKCRLLLKSLGTDRKGVISTQVLCEFYVAVTKKLRVDPLLTKNIMHAFKQLETVVVRPGIIYEAIDCSDINRISFWDALIIATAESARCEKLWTEDLNDGQIIRSKRITNPLRE